MLPIFYSCFCGYRIAGNNFEEISADILSHTELGKIACYQNVIQFKVAPTKNELE
jgi:hypothetical protein